MKKKLFTGVLALVCAMTCVFAFTACGGSDPKKMKSEKVTAEQWAEALKKDNFTNVKIESTLTQEGPYEKEDGTKEPAKVTVKSTVVVADGVQYYKSEATVEKGPQEFKDLAKTMNFEKYSSVTNGKYTTYYQNKDGKWRQYPSEGGVADEVIAEYVSYGPLYSKFAYAEGWAKGYWGNVDMLEYPELVKKVLKFKKGKLAAVFYENQQSSGDDYKSEYESTTLEYGEQTLTLPTPEASSYAGKWKTKQLIVDNNTYNVGNTIPEIYDITLSADFSKVEIKNDGTFTYSTVEPSSGSGIWMETGEGLLIIADNLGYLTLEVSGATLKMPYQGMTIVFEKE